MSFDAPALDCPLRFGKVNSKKDWCTDVLTLCVSIKSYFGQSPNCAIFELFCCVLAIRFGCFHESFAILLRVVADEEGFELVRGYFLSSLVLWIGVCLDSAITQPHREGCNATTGFA